MNSNAAVSWPDWTGQTAAIIGTGPSASWDSLEALRGRARIFVIKTSWRLAPFADALYGIDVGWWVANRGCREFAGRKFSPAPSVCKLFPEVTQITLKPRAEILTKETGVIGCGLRTDGGFSGFQAINLAVQWGAKRILLVGFDMTLAHGAHWHNDYRGVGKPAASRTLEWRDSMDACAPQFEKLGIEVLNSSQQSALRAYQKVDYNEFARLLS